MKPSFAVHDLKVGDIVVDASNHRRQTNPLLVVKKLQHTTGISAFMFAQMDTHGIHIVNLFAMFFTESLNDRRIIVDELKQTPSWWPTKPEKSSVTGEHLVEGCAYVYPVNHFLPEGRIPRENTVREHRELIELCTFLYRVTDDKRAAVMSILRLFGASSNQLELLALSLIAATYDVGGATDPVVDSAITVAMMKETLPIPLSDT